MISLVMVATLVAVVVAVLLFRVVSAGSLPPDERPSEDEGLPWTVKAYAGAYVISSLIYGFFSPYGQNDRSVIPWLAGFAIFFLLMVLPIIGGSKVGWMIVTPITLLSFATLPNSGSTAGLIIALASGLVHLGLLVHPETQRWCGLRARRLVRPLH